VIDGWEQSNVPQEGNVSLSLQRIKKLQGQIPSGLSSCDHSSVGVILRGWNLDAGELPHPTEEPCDRTSPQESAGFVSLVMNQDRDGLMELWRPASPCRGGAE
jgi:hypothetical protein